MKILPTGKKKCANNKCKIRPINKECGCWSICDKFIIKNKKENDN